MFIKKLLPLALVMSVLFACVPQVQYASVSLTPQFELSNYTAVATSDTDLTGAWIALLAGTREETKNNIDFTTQGYIREIVQITEESGVFYARACTKAEEKTPVNINGNSVTFTLNNINFSLTKSSFKNMAGTGSTTESGVTYTPSVAMRKIAPPDTTFGTFLFNTALDADETRTADCFNESNLAVTAVAGFLSETSYLEVFNATAHDGLGEYDQTAYVYQYSGTVTPTLRTITFVDGVDGSGPNASREGTSLARTKVAINASGVDVNITSNSISATGAIDIVIP